MLGRPSFAEANRDATKAELQPGRAQGFQAFMERLNHLIGLIAQKGHGQVQVLLGHRAQARRQAVLKGAKGGPGSKGQIKGDEKAHGD